MMNASTEIADFNGRTAGSVRFSIQEPIGFPEQFGKRPNMMVGYSLKLGDNKSMLIFISRSYFEIMEVTAGCMTVSIQFNAQWEGYDRYREFEKDYQCAWLFLGGMGRSAVYIKKTDFSRLKELFPCKNV